MGLTALLLTARAALGADTVPPYLTFPEAGLDDPAAYQGYETRVYRDARRNAFQVYLDRRRGRVVHLWAVSGAGRSVAYRLEAGSPLRLGLFLLGSMRVERDFGYADRDSLPLGAAAFPEPALLGGVGRKSTR